MWSASREVFGHAGTVIGTTVAVVGIFWLIGQPHVEKYVDQRIDDKKHAPIVLVEQAMSRVTALQGSVSVALNEINDVETRVAKAETRQDSMLENQRETQRLLREIITELRRR